MVESDRLPACRGSAIRAAVKDLDNILRVASKDLPAAGVDCLLIGGFAVNHYGYTRNTLDVDFIMVGDRLDDVKRAMKDAGFTNISIQKNVAFFSAPGSTMRCDFLQTDRGTMDKLLAGACAATVQGYGLRVPALKDLIAMKIFALSQAVEQRMGKDLPDIAYLIVLNDLELERDIRPLCDRFGNDEVFERIRVQVNALGKP